MDHIFRIYQCLLYIVLMSVATCRAAQQATNNIGAFIFPNPNSTSDVADLPVYNYQDTVNTSWASRYESPWLYLWCNTAGDFAIVSNLSVPATGNQLMSLEPANNSFCHFQLVPQPVDAPDSSTLNSGAFNVTEIHDLENKTWSAPQSGSDNPSGSAAISTLSPTDTPSQSAQTSSQHASSGLSTGVKAGIGVAVAVAVLILLSVVTFLALKARRRRQAQRNAIEEKNQVMPWPTGVAPAPWVEGTAVQPGLTNIVKQEIDGEPVNNLELDSAPMKTTGERVELRGDTAMKSP